MWICIDIYKTGEHPHNIHSGKIIVTRSKYKIQILKVICLLIFLQVVTLATYSFLIASIFGRQFIGKGEDEISVDIFFPTWAVLENLFYLGLLKV